MIVLYVVIWYYSLSSNFENDIFYLEWMVEHE